MSRWLRFLRTVMALCAIVAYALPAATHGAPAGHADHAAQPGSTSPCAHDPGAVDHHVHATAAADGEHANVPDAPAKCPGHKEGSVSCCVAMCHAALPMAECAAPWVPWLRASSHSRIVDSAGPTFITRLDRPPKPGVAPIG